MRVKTNARFYLTTFFEDSDCNLKEEPVVSVNNYGNVIHWSYYTRDEEGRLYTNNLCRTDLISCHFISIEGVANVSTDSGKVPGR